MKGRKTTNGNLVVTHCFEAESLKKHISAIHNGYKGYKCGSCSKAFSQESNLKRHVHTVHEGKKDHNCELCDKSFIHCISQFEVSHSNSSWRLQIPNVNIVVNHFLKPNFLINFLMILIILMILLLPQGDFF